jgi:sugar lactone lactonase YvrE
MTTPLPDPPASPFRCVLDAKASLGECPVWAVAEQALYWVDINAPALHRFDPATGDNKTMPMPESIGCVGLREGGGFIVALRTGFWFADQDGTLTSKIADAPYDSSTHRFNDGRCNRQGRFFAGYMNEKRDANSAALVRLDTDGRMTTLFGDIMISNGLAFSPDGRTMYHADTPTRTIHAYDFDTRSGTPSNRRVLAKFDGETDRPDGGAVDSEGCYWSAFYRGGKVLRLSPTGEVLATFAVPAMCPTMCAFGGSDLKTLYVTTARHARPDDELTRLPHSGGVFAMIAAVPGLPEPSFAG